MIRVRVKPGRKHGSPLAKVYRPGDELTVTAAEWRAFRDKFERVEDLPELPPEPPVPAMPEPDLFEALGDPVTAQLLANHGYDTVAKVRAAADGDLLAISGIGRARLKMIKEAING